MDREKHSLDIATNAFIFPQLKEFFQLSIENNW